LRLCGFPRLGLTKIDPSGKFFESSMRGKCENLHGHDWKVEVVLHGANLWTGAAYRSILGNETATGEALKKVDYKYLN
jgi:6-pyruvoyltetrahydropterin/6-carboxytetrahydropterin synthase